MTRLRSELDVAMEQAMRRAKKKFEKLDVDGYAVLGARDLVTLADCSWSAFHPGGMALTDQEKQACRDKLLHRVGDGVMRFEEFREWFLNAAVGIQNFREATHAQSRRAVPNTKRFQKLGQSVAEEKAARAVLASAVASGDSARAVRAQQAMVTSNAKKLSLQREATREQQQRAVVVSRRAQAQEEPQLRYFSMSEELSASPENVTGLTQDEERRVSQVFQEMDRDATGSLDVSELLMTESPSQRAAQMACLDVDQNGMVDWGEFKRYFVNKKKEKGAARFSALLDFLDMTVKGTCSEDTEDMPLDGVEFELQEATRRQHNRAKGKGSFCCSR